MNKLIVLFLLLGFFACTEGPENGSVETQSYGPPADSVAEHEFKHIVKNEGPKPEVGDLVTYMQKTYLNDSLLGDPKSFGLARTDVLPADSMLKAPYNPTYAAMFKMSAGDSVNVSQPLKNVDVLPSTLSRDDVFNYEIKLYKFESEEEAKKRLAEYLDLDKTVNDQMQKFISEYTSGALDDQLTTTSTGIKYLVREEGKGEKGIVGNPIFINFSSFLLDGKSLFSTFLTGTEINFPLGKQKMIPGMEEMVAKFPKGSKLSFIVPPELGYGATGKSPQIPEDAEIAFYMEILNY